MNNIKYESTVDLIYNYIDDFDSFFNFLLNENNITIINEFIYTLDSLSDIENKNNIYIYLIFLLYNEEISINNLFKNDFQIIDNPNLENEVIKRIINNINTKSVKKNIYVRDLIINTFHSIKTNNIIYKNLESIISTVEIIYNSLSFDDKENIDNIFHHILDYDKGIDTLPLLTKLFLRINYESSLVEENIQVFSYILNYETYGDEVPLGGNVNEFTITNKEKLKNSLLIFNTKLNNRIIKYESGEL